MEDLSLHILDLSQNSINADATLIKITIRDINEDCLSVVIEDNGKGMEEENIAKALDPFYTTRTTRRVGLGIPLFKASAEATGGHISIISQIAKGTKIEAVFCKNHIDCIPIGKMQDTIATLILCNPDVDIIYTHQFEEKEFIFNTCEIRKLLDGLSITHPEVIGWITEYLIDNLNEIYGGV